jgi:hypothetical protein
LATPERGIHVLAEIHRKIDDAWQKEPSVGMEGPFPTATKYSSETLSNKHGIFVLGINKADSNVGSSSDNIGSNATDISHFSSSADSKQPFTTNIFPILQDQSKLKKLHKRFLPSIATHPNAENVTFTCHSNPDLTHEKFQIPTLLVEPQRVPTQNSDLIDDPLATRHARQSLTWDNSISSGLLLSPNKSMLKMCRESQIGLQTETEIGRRIQKF